MPVSRANAPDHVVLVIFENRSFDNLLGRLYQPGEVPSFEGVIGKDLTNPIPPWAEHGKEHAVVPYDVASGMDDPNPDPGEEYQHKAVLSPSLGPSGRPVAGGPHHH
jgi:phospholipase C